MGQFNQVEPDPELFAEAGGKGFNPVFAMKRVISAKDLNTFLASLPPRHHQYLGLKAGLAHYRTIAENGGWPTVPGWSKPAAREILTNASALCGKDYR